MIEVITRDNCNRAGQAAAKHLVDGLTQNSRLQNLLLLSGGSSIQAAYWATTELGVNNTNSTVLAQVDERYGREGHPDSNWKALTELGVDPGLFQQSIEMLKLGLSAEDIAAEYSKQLQYQIDQADYSIALLGLGSDSHIAGILPMAEEAFGELFLSESLVAHYMGPDFERLTLTARALMQLDELVVFACGESKAEAVSELSNTHEPHIYPSEILANCKKVTVYYGKDQA